MEKIKAHWDYIDYMLLDNDKKPYKGYILKFNNYMVIKRGEKFFGVYTKYGKLITGAPTFKQAAKKAKFLQLGYDEGYDDGYDNGRYSCRFFD